MIVIAVNDASMADIQEESYYDVLLSENQAVG